MGFLLSLYEIDCLLYNLILNINLNFTFFSSDAGRTKSKTTENISGDAANASNKVNLS